MAPKPLLVWQLVHAKVVPGRETPPSIATGIGLGFIAYVALKLLAGRVKEINAAAATIAGAFLLKLVFA